MGRQIIDTTGARQTIARRRLLIVLAVLILIVALAATVYFVRSTAGRSGSRAHAAAPALTGVRVATLGRVELGRSPNGFR
jgi:flagellar basal body-associated protein FliL